MRRPRTTLAIATAGVVAGATGLALRDGDRRHRLDRQARVWRLTARRSVHWTVLKVRGRRANEEQRARLEEHFAIRTAEDVAAVLGGMKGAIMKAGRVVAVKVQYPGVDKAIRSDLDNAELLYGLFASFALKNLDVKALVDELRARMADELDYRHEAACQQEFADRYAGHPFFRVPNVVPERSSQRS